MKLRGFLLIVATMVNVKAYSQEVTYPTVNDLRTASQPTLNQMYLNSEAGSMPDGESEGTAIFFANSKFNHAAQVLANLVWQGKIFDLKQEVLVNRVLGFKAIKAEISYGESLFDGRESIIIDYGQTSRLFGRVRDEIREVAPGVYLGRAYWRTKMFGGIFVVNFVLNFNRL